MGDRTVVGRFDFGKTGGGNNSGFESLLYVNGAPFQGVDANHQEVFFPAELSGSTISLCFRLWSGLEGGGAQKTNRHEIRRAEIGWLDEDADDLYFSGKAIAETVSILATEAASMLTKYLELMGVTSAELVKKAATPALLPEKALLPSVSDEKIKIFVEDYLKKSIKALNMNDFSIVEPYFDKTGKKYKEQSEYIEYLKGKGIDESLLAVDAKTVEKLNDSSFKVTTFEQYDISYGDGSHKIKSFTSKYKVVKSENNGFPGNGQN